MQSGTISTVIDYYTLSPDFENECETALKYFFEVSSVDALAIAQISQTEQGLFNEWFLYDFLLPNGNTPLEQYIIDNPHQLRATELSVYELIRDTQHFGVFEVVSIRLGSELELRDIYTNITHRIRERSGTYQIQVGNLLPQRIAKINDHWEIVGADSIILPEAIRSVMTTTLKPTQLTPQIIRKIIVMPDTPVEKVDPSPVEADKHLEQTLRDYDIHQMVSVTTIKRWIYELCDKQHPTLPITLVVGLPDKEKFLLDDMQPLVVAVMDVMNTSPRADLDGQSPQQVISERSTAGHAPQFQTKTSELGGHWLQLYQQAVEQMAEQNFPQAIHSYEKMFSTLLRHQEVDGQIYRMFTNSGIAFLAFGEKLHGKKMLELALKLNPNYDFGQLTIQRLETGVFEADMKRARQYRQQLRKPITILPWRDQVALQYYNWLITLGINFKTEQLTTTPVVGL